MKRRTAVRLAYGSALAAVAAVVAAACSSSSTSPHLGTPCAKYSGGGATPTTLAGSYTLSSFCQDTLPAFGPAQGFTGTLTMTHGASVDSFEAVINIPNQSPLPIAGPYVLSNDTMIVTVQGLGTFPVAYKFASHASADTLFASGYLPGNPPPPIAIVFAK